MPSSAGHSCPPCPRFVELCQLVLAHCGGTTGIWSSGVRLRLAAPALRRVTTVVPLGDLDAFVAEIDFDAELAPEGADVAGQGVDLRVFDLTGFQGTDGVLANGQEPS